MQEARKTRYPVVLVVGMDAQVQPDVWREFAEARQMAFLDLLEEAQRRQFRSVATVWPTLVDWIRKQASEAGGVVVIEVDALATAWDDDGRERFFDKLLRSETKADDGTGEPAPIVAVSQLAAQYDLPRGSRDHGIVLDLSS